MLANTYPGYMPRVENFLGLVVSAAAAGDLIFEAFAVRSIEICFDLFITEWTAEGS